MHICMCTCTYSVPVQIHFVVQLQSLGKVFMLTIQRFCSGCTCTMFVPLVLPVQGDRQTHSNKFYCYNVQIYYNAPIKTRFQCCNSEVTIGKLHMVRVKVTIPEASRHGFKQVRPTFLHVRKQILKRKTEKQENNRLSGNWSGEEVKN